MGLPQGLVVTAMRSGSLEGAGKNVGTEIFRTGVRGHVHGHFSSKTLDIEVRGF